MKRLLAIALIGFVFCLAGPGFAADGDEVACDNKHTIRGWECKRYIIMDSRSTTGTSSPKTIPKLDGKATAADFYTFTAEVSDTCTTLAVIVSQHRSAATTNCDGSCDSYPVISWADTTVNVESYWAAPLFYAFDANISSVTACTLTVFLDVYWKLN